MDIFVENLGRWRSSREILSIPSPRLKFRQYLQGIELTFVFPSVNQFLRLLGQRRYRRRISFIIIAIWGRVLCTEPLFEREKIVGLNLMEIEQAL